MFRVMKPSYTKLQEGDYWRIQFTPVPNVVVSSMSEARRLYGCAVVLEFIRGAV